MEQKDKTESNEQQAADTREHAVNVEVEHQKFCDGILTLMDKNLIPSASTGEPKMSHCTMVGDCYRYLAELATVEAKCKAAEDACVAYAKATKITEKFIDKAVDVPVMLQRQVPVFQKMRKTVEVPQVQHINKFVDVPVVAQRQAPIIQTLQKKVEVPQVQFLDRAVGVPVVTQTQVPSPSAPQGRIQERIVEETDVPVPVPRVMEKILEAVKFIPQERVQNYTAEQLVDVPDSQIPAIP